MIVTMDLTHFAPTGSVANVTSTQTKAVSSSHPSVPSKPLVSPALAVETTAIATTRMQASATTAVALPVHLMEIKDAAAIHHSVATWAKDLSARAVVIMLIASIQTHRSVLQGNVLNAMPLPTKAALGTRQIVRLIPMVTSV